MSEAFQQVYLEEEPPEQPVNVHLLPYPIQVDLSHIENCLIQNRVLKVSRVQVESDGAVNALPGWENFPDTQVPLSLAQVGCIGVGTLFQTNSWQALPLSCPTPQPQPQAIPPPPVNVKSFSNHVLFIGAGTWSKKRDAPRHLDHMINNLKMSKSNIYSSAQTRPLPPQKSANFFIFW